MFMGDYNRKLMMGYRPKSEKDSEPASLKEFGVSIEVDNDVYQKIMHWIDKSEFEVSGLGLVEYDKEENTFRVTDAILLPQKNTHVTTELDSAAIAKAMFLFKDKPGQLRWWWHSHVDMDTFWSGTDTSTIKELGVNGWIIATVFNKKREMKSALCIADPIRLFVDDIDTEIIEHFDENIIAEWDKEYDKNVENKTFSFARSEKETDSTKLPSAWALPDDDDRDVPPPELADIFPREKEEEEHSFTHEEEEALSYFSLEELSEMREKGMVSEKVWDEAIERATDEELDAFFQCTELEEMDMSTKNAKKRAHRMED